MKPFVLTSTLILSAFLLAACGSSKEVRTGPLALDEDQLGPVSKKLLKNLPRDLVGDKQNAQYTSEVLQGKDEDGTQ